MNSREYDVVIIGGGIIGLSTAMQLGRRFAGGLKVAVVEKEQNLANHQTGHNSGVIHSGIYYRPGSQKAQFCVGGARSLKQFCDENEIEYELCGKTIVATDESELPRLDNLYERGVANGVPGLEMIGPERLKEIEPHTFGLRALWSPATGIIDYVQVTEAYASRFQEQGGDIYMDAAVQSIGGTDGAMTVGDHPRVAAGRPRYQLCRPVRRPHRRDDGGNGQTSASSPSGANTTPCGPRASTW